MLKNKKNLSLIVVMFMFVGILFACSNNATNDNQQINMDAQNGNEKSELDDTSETFSIMSFNIRTDANDGGYKNWSVRKAKVIEYIISKDADIVCLQEVKENQYYDLAIALSDYYNILYYTRDDKVNSEGLAICYKDDFALVAQQRFWLSETPDVMSTGWGASYYRICVNVLLKSRLGRYINVYNVHLDHQVEAARTNGIELILNDAAKSKYETIICGDFNAPRESECYEKIASVMSDCQAEATETDSGPTFQNWGEATTDDLEIDFCFVSNDIKINSFDICQEKDENNNYYSDHYAIISNITMVCE